MKNYPKYINNTLHTSIRDMAKHPENFCRDPQRKMNQRT